MREEYVVRKLLTLTDVTSLGHIRTIRSEGGDTPLPVDTHQGRNSEPEPVPYCPEAGRRTDEF